MKRREEQLPALTLSREEYAPEMPAAETNRRPPRFSPASARALGASDTPSSLKTHDHSSAPGNSILQVVRASASDAAKTRISNILRDGSLKAAFQPIYNLATGHVAGVEALARFRNETAPDVWFAQAATIGLAVDMEVAAVEAALSAAAQLPEHLYVSVNVSPTTCVSPRFRQLFRKHPMPADRIVLELTEHKPVDDYTPLLNALAPLRNSGMRVAVDDAGAGHSSMLHILRLAPDVIKLDKELITDIDTNPLQKALGRAMVNFAWDIGATITAEGIETAAELASVTELGMTSGQGYFLGHPTLLPDQWAQWQSQTLEEPQPDNAHDRGLQVRI